LVNINSLFAALYGIIKHLCLIQKMLRRQTLSFIISSVALSACTVHSFSVPRIIQGGMGIRISSWELARAVSQKGELGVISGTGIDTILVRSLQNGTP
jgi:hypothetical protein